MQCFVVLFSVFMFRSLLDLDGLCHVSAFYIFIVAIVILGIIFSTALNTGDWIGLGTSKEGGHLVSFLGFNTSYFSLHIGSNLVSLVVYIPHHKIYIGGLSQSLYIILQF